MTSSGRKLVVVGVLCAAFLVGIGAYLREAARPILRAGPMVQRVGPDRFTLVWRTPSVDGGEVLVVGPDGPRRVESTLEDGQHVARITGLSPGAEYHYMIRQHRSVGDPLELATASVRTARPPGEPVRFLVFGDSGAGSNSQISLSERMVKHPCDLVLHTGDLIYMAGEREHYEERFFAPYAELIRSVPFYPSLGNHDVITENGAPLLEAFVLPENGPEQMKERCYWFEYGDVRFIALDSTPDGPPLREHVVPWLRQVLAEATTTWRILFFHHPPYTNSKHGPDMKTQEILVPVFEEGGVDVVFVGHNHLYERTKPIREGTVVPEGEGVIYVITGAGGNALYAENPEPVDYIAAHNDDMHSFTVVDIRGSTLRLQQINILGRVIDDWTYERPVGTRTTGDVDTES